MSDDVSNGEMGRWLTRVEGKLDKVADDHEQRLRRTERVMYVAVGLAVAGASSGIASMVAAIGGAA